MKLRVIALGHRMPGWVRAGWEDYSRRMPRELGLELLELKPEPREGGKPVKNLLASEAKRIRQAAHGARLVALDERGEAWTTAGLAQQLAAWRMTGEDVAFAIGSADGLDADLLREASATVSLSALTLPHALVRVLLAEQLYRAASLLAGHPYHRV